MKILGMIIAMILIPLVVVRIISPFPRSVEIVLSGNHFSVEIAKSRKELIHGLSGKGSIGDKEGLLMIFEIEDRHGIWMKEMSFPIDIIWLDGDLKVVDIANNIYPETFPTIFYPRVPAFYVLEINAGLAGEYGISIGDRAKILTNLE